MATTSHSFSQPILHIQRFFMKVISYVLNHNSAPKSQVNEAMSAKSMRNFPVRGLHVSTTRAVHRNIILKTERPRISAAKSENQLIKVSGRDFTIAIV